MPVPLDEYPIHQGPQTMKYFVTSDRNVYDRCIMHALSPDGVHQVAVGLGVYPHVGVIDCYMAVRDGRRLSSARTSGVLGDDRMRQEVGPMRIEVVEGLQTVRFVCDEIEGVERRPHLGWRLPGHRRAPPHPARRRRRDPRCLPVRPDGHGSPARSRWTATVLDATAEGWSGARDRSWGVRPVGQGAPAGQPVEPAHVVVLDPTALRRLRSDAGARGGPDGYRTINEAVRVWPDGRIEQLGWAEPHIEYRSGTRYPTRARIGLKERGGRGARARHRAHRVRCR